MKEVKNLEAIIFDVDGVLYSLPQSGKNNSIFSTSFYREVKERGIAFISQKLRVEINKGKEIWERIFEKYGGNISIGLEKEFGIDRYEYFNNVWNINPSIYIPYESVEEVRRYIKRIRVRKGILSNAPRVWVENVLRYFSILEDFEWIYTGESDIRKPDKRIYLYILDYFRAKPEEIVIIDDEPQYLLTPKELGFLTGLVCTENYEEIKFDFYGRNLIEILEKLNEIYKIFG